MSSGNGSFEQVKCSCLFTIVWCSPTRFDRPRRYLQVGFMLENFPRRFKVHRFVTHKSGIRLSHVVGRKLFFESASFIPRDLCQFIVAVACYLTPISKTQFSFIYFNSHCSLSLLLFFLIFIYSCFCFYCY